MFINSLDPHSQPMRQGWGGVIIPILQIRKLRSKAIGSFVHGYLATATVQLPSARCGDWTVTANDIASH